MQVEANNMPCTRLDDNRIRLGREDDLLLVMHDPEFAFEDLEHLRLP
jgi:hypothetical protein